MGFPSLTELMIVLGIVVLLFGAKQLPKLGGAVGESIKNFRKGIKDQDDKKSLPSDPNDPKDNGKTE